MKKTVFKNHRKKWQALSVSWQNFTEPSRPSRGDVINYNKLLVEALKGKEGASVLVLGSTPEIRELLFKFWITKKIKVVCADMTREMYDAMSELVDNKIKDEKFVVANWLDMKFDHKFDVVIGDFVNGNIGEKYKDAFFNNIESLLKTNGYFIHRDATVSSDCKIPNVEYVFKKFVKEVMTEEYTLKKAANMAANYLVWASWFKNNSNKTSLAYFWRDIEKFGKKIAEAKSEKNLIARAIFERFLSAWGPYKDKYWTYNTIQTDNKILKKYFKIKKVLFADDYFTKVAKNSPMYMLKK
ncbi:MAG: class I SAM-dependent methyltransferase [Candidatus Moranbacteria bacterium]|nr:class I SAM-dependent methyltransferase [Candidatus Moranbacteria bacterium]